MLAIKSRKTSVVLIPKLQYNHSRILPTDDPSFIIFFFGCPTSGGFCQKWGF